jgi:hypothetical protein
MPPRTCFTIHSHRLSEATASVLRALADGGGRIAWSADRGQYEIGRRLISGRTLELLLNTRLVERDRSATTPAFSISRAGREVLDKIGRAG